MKRKGYLALLVVFGILAGIVCLSSSLGKFPILSNLKLPNLLNRDKNALPKVEFDKKTGAPKVKNYIANGDFKEHYSIFGQIKAKILPQKPNQLPEGWEFYKESPDFSDPEIKVVTEKPYTYVKESALFIDAASKGVGIARRLPSNLKPPFFVQANVLVLSGEAKLALVGKDGNEISSDKVGVGDNRGDDFIEPETSAPWKKLSALVENEEKQADEVRVYSSVPYTKLYITNLTVSTPQNYSSFVEEVKEEKKVAISEDCKQEPGGRQEECVSRMEKSNLNWELTDEVKLFYKGEEVVFPDADNRVLGQVSGASTTKVMFVGFSSDFDESSRAELLSYIEDSWRNESINKNISLSGARVEIFDPTLPTLCSIWVAHQVLYLPDTFCQLPITSPNDAMIVFLKAGYFGHMSALGAYFPKILFSVDPSQGDYFFQLKFGIKHEFGHVLAAPDTDFVNIRGNNLFPSGNYKDGTVYDDVMYSIRLNTSEYVRKVINTLSYFQYPPLWGFHPQSLLLVDTRNGERVSGDYKIFYGMNMVRAHQAGEIKSEPYSEGLSENGEIPLAKYTLPVPPPVGGYYFISPCPTAGFILLQDSESKIYKGKFDLIDLSMAYWQGQSSLVVSMEGEDNFPEVTEPLSISGNSGTFAGVEVLPVETGETIHFNFAVKDDYGVAKINLSLQKLGDPPDSFSQLYTYQGCPRGAEVCRISYDWDVAESLEDGVAYRCAVSEVIDNLGGTPHFGLSSFREGGGWRRGDTKMAAYFVPHKVPHTLVSEPLSVIYDEPTNVIRASAALTCNRGMGLNPVMLWYREKRDYETPYYTESPAEGWVLIYEKNDCPQVPKAPCRFLYSWPILGNLERGKDYQFIIEAFRSETASSITGDIFRSGDESGDIIIAEDLYRELRLPPAVEPRCSCAATYYFETRDTSICTTERNQCYGPDSRDGGSWDFALMGNKCICSVYWCGTGGVPPSGDCNCSVATTNDRTEDYPSEERCLGNNSALLSCRLPYSSNSNWWTGIKRRWGNFEGGKCFEDVYICGDNGNPPQVVTPLTLGYRVEESSLRVSADLVDDTYISSIVLFYREAQEGFGGGYGAVDPSQGWVFINSFHDCPQIFGQLCHFDYDWSVPNEIKNGKSYQYTLTAADSEENVITGDIFSRDRPNVTKDSRLLAQISFPGVTAINPCDGRPDSAIVINGERCYRCRGGQLSDEVIGDVCRAAKANVCQQTADGGQARFERYDCACSGGLVTTCTALPQFGTCGACSSDAWGGCTPPEECRLVNDQALCQANNKPDAPCCLRDPSCAPGQHYNCGYASPNHYCDKCHRFQNYSPWCTDWQYNCGAGAPARPRLKSPANAATMAEAQSVALSWYAFGEGLPEKCGESIAGNWPKWEDCHGEWHWNNTPAKCISEFGASGGNAGDRDCWGYVCARGSLGIPSPWRFYKVLVKGPADGDFREVCSLRDIPNPPDAGQGLPAEKTSCPFTPLAGGNYQWFVRAGYSTATQGGIYTNQTDSPISSFTFSMPADAFPTVSQPLRIGGSGKELTAFLAGGDDVAIEKVLVHYASEGQSNWQKVVGVDCGQRSCSLSQGFTLPQDLAPGNYTFVASLWDHVIPAAGQHFGTTGANTFLSSDCTPTSTYCYSDKLRFNLAVQPPASIPPQCSTLTLDKTQAAPEDPVKVGVTGKSGSSNFKATSAITLVALRVSDNSTHGILTFSRCDGVDAKTTPCTDTTQGFTPAHAQIPQAGLYKFYVAMVNQEGKGCDDFPGTPVANQCGCGVKDLTVTTPPAPDAFPTVSQALRIEGTGKDFRATAVGEDETAIEKMVVHFALEGQANWQEVVSVSCGQRQCSLNQAFTLPQALSPGRYKFIASLWDHTVPAAGQHFGTTGANFESSDCSPTATYCHSAQLQFILEIQPPAPFQPPACSSLSLSPQSGTFTTDFKADLSCTSGSNPFARLYLMIRKSGTTGDRIRLTPGDGLCFGQTACTTSFTFKPANFPGLGSVGAYDVWLSSRTAGPDGQLETADDGRCTEIPEGIEGVGRCGAGVRQITLTAPCLGKKC